MLITRSHIFLNCITSKLHRKCSVYVLERKKIFSYNINAIRCSQWLMSLKKSYCKMIFIITKCVIFSHSKAHLFNFSLSFSFNLIICFNSVFFSLDHNHTFKITKKISNCFLHLIQRIMYSFSTFNSLSFLNETER